MIYALATDERSHSPTDCITHAAHDVLLCNTWHICVRLCLVDWPQHTESACHRKTQQSIYMQIIGNIARTHTYTHSLLFLRALSCAHAQLASWLGPVHVHAAHSVGNARIKHCILKYSPANLLEHGSYRNVLAKIWRRPFAVRMDAAGLLLVTIAVDVI